VQQYLRITIGTDAEIDALLKAVRRSGKVASNPRSTLRR